MKVDSGDCVRLRNNRGSDEANVAGHSYPRGPDGAFTVPLDVAEWLLAVPAGFYLDDQPSQLLETHR